MSDDEHEMSIESLKYLDSGSKMKESALSPCQNLDGHTIPLFISPSCSPFHSKQAEQTNPQFQSLMPPKASPNPSCTSMSVFNKKLLSISDIGFGSFSTTFLADENQVGSEFLRQMFAGPQPMKNYMNYLKKEKVDLTDQRDASVVMMILSKETKQPQESNFLLKSIQGMHIFQKNKDMLTMKDCNQQLLEQFKMEYYPARKTVFNYGEFGYTYYIVLSGGADLLIPSPTHEDSISPKNKEDEEKEINQNKKKKGLKLNSKWNVLKNTFVPDQDVMAQNILDQQERQLDSAVDDDESYDDFISRSFPNMNFIKTFKPGEAFGEIALMTKQRRTGSIVCREGTHLMALTKEGFDIILGSYHKNIVQRKLNYLRNYGFFKNMPDSKLLALLHFMKIVKYRNKNIVYTEGDPSRFVYFIREGEVEISQVCNIEENLDKVKRNQHVIEEEDDHYEINQIKVKKDMRNKNKRIPIVIKGSCSYFGEDEILRHVDTRKQQAICSSEEAEIFLLKKDILYNYTRGYHVVEKIKEEFKVKGTWNEKHKANVMLTRQNTKFDIEKQMNQLSVTNQQGQASPKRVLHESSKNIELKPLLPSSSNIFSLTKQFNPSLTNISSQVTKRNSFLSQTISSNRLIQVDVKNENDPPIFSQPVQFRVGLPVSVGQDKNNNRNERSQQQQLFSQDTSISQSLTRMKDPLEIDEQNVFSSPQPKLTTGNKIILKLNSQKKQQLPVNPFLSPTFSNTFKQLEQDGQFLQKSTRTPATLSEEEIYLENKMLSSLKKKYFGIKEQSKEQLDQIALEQFGSTSHHAYVSKVGKVIENKREILKKLNSNGLTTPANAFKDLYEEFGLRKGVSTKSQKSTNSSISQPQPFSKLLTIKTQSAPNGHEFQKRILQDRKSQIKETLRRQCASPSAEEASFFSATTNSFNKQPQFQYMNPSSLIHMKSSENKKTDQWKSTDDENISRTDSSNSSQYSVKRSLLIDNFPQKTNSMMQINNLDILEEVSESNSPTKPYYKKSMQDHELKISEFDDFQKSQGSSSCRIVLENICNNAIEENAKCRKASIETKYTSQYFPSPFSKTQTESITNGKGFFNRNFSNIRIKQDARQMLSRNSSVSTHCKENSFRITNKQNNFLIMGPSKSMSTHNTKEVGLSQ